MGTLSLENTQLDRVSALAERGDVDGAVAALGEAWRGPLVYPNLSGKPEARAATLCAVGYVTEQVGRTKQIAGAQEHAKNLYSEAVDLLMKNGEDPSEAQVRLAVTYLREGQYDESEIILRQMSPVSDLGKAKQLLTLACIRHFQNRPAEAMSLLQEAEPVFEAIDGILRGKFHLQRGLAHKHLGNIDAAIIEYEAANVYFDGDPYWQANLRTNRSELFLAIKDSQRALELVDKAISEGRRLQNKGDLASCLETKARILLSALRLKEARIAVNEAVSIFRQGDEHSLLCQALTTQGRILARLGLPANEVFEEALQHAEFGDQYGAANVYLTMLEELDLDYLRMSEFYEKADALLGESNADGRLRACASKIVSFVPRTLDEVKEIAKDKEARLINAALVKHKGSVRQVAKELGTGHRRIQYHVERNPKITAKRLPPPKRSIML